MCGAFLVRQCDELIDPRNCCRVISAKENMGVRSMAQRIHQRGDFAGPARIPERVVSVCERRLRIAE